jgi:hypothetical protein
MTSVSHRLAACSLLLAAGAITAPAWADSLASSASSVASESVGSISTSIQKSSNSSSNDRRVAQGDYRVIELAQATDRPGLLRLKLRGVDEAQGEFVLILPQPAVAQAGLESGQVVSVRERPYGLEFALAGAAFFLVLDDAWHRELQTRVVQL